MNEQFKLLIIDDDDEDLELMQAAIKKSQINAEIHLSKNGERGVEKARNLKPSMAIIDTNMPDINGFETAKRIKALSELDVKIILCTGGGVDFVDAGAAREAGADGYCVKTDNYADLIDEVISLI
jgi:DNA-binding response OmpR family regulator